MPPNVNVNITATDVNFSKTMAAMQVQMKSAAGMTLALQTAMGGLKTVTLLGAVGLAAMVAPTLLISKAFATFDASLRRAIAVGGPTYIGQMNALSKSITNTAIQWGISSDEIAAGVVELAKAGFDYNTVTQQMMTGVSQLAKVHQESFENISNIVTYAYSLYGDETMTATNLMDKMNEAANISVLNIGELGQAFEYAGASAMTSGVTIDEFLASISALSQVATKSYQNIGTLLNRMLVSGEELEKKLGVTTGTFVKDGVLNLSAFFKYLDKVPNRYEVIVKASELWGVRSTRVVQAMMAVPEEYVKFLGEIQNSQGNLADQSGQMAESLQSTWTSLMETLTQPIKSGTVLSEIQKALKDLKVALSESELPSTLQKLIETSTNFMQIYGKDLIKSLSQLGLMLVDMLPTLYSSAKVMMSFMEAILKINKAFESLHLSLLPTIVAFMMLRKLFPMESIDLAIVSFFRLRNNVQTLDVSMRSMSNGIIQLDSDYSAKMASMTVSTGSAMKTMALTTNTGMNAMAVSTNAATTSMATSTKNNLNSMAITAETTTTRMINALQQVGGKNYRVSIMGGDEVSTRWSPSWNAPPAEIQSVAAMQNAARQATATRLGLNINQIPMDVERYLPQTTTQAVSPEVLKSAQTLLPPSGPTSATVAYGQQEWLKSDTYKEMMSQIQASRAPATAPSPMVQQMTAPAIKQVTEANAELASQLEITNGMIYTQSQTIMDGEKVVFEYDATYKALVDTKTGDLITTGQLIAVNDRLGNSVPVSAFTKLKASLMGVKAETLAASNAMNAQARAMMNAQIRAQVLSSTGLFLLAQGFFLLISSKDKTVRMIGAVTIAIGALAVVVWGLASGINVTTLGLAALAAVGSMAVMYAAQKAQEKSMQADQAAGEAKIRGTYAKGGFVEETGLALIHKDEYVIPRESSPIMTFRKPEMVKATGLAYLKKDDYVVPVKSTAISPIITSGKTIPEYKGGGYVKNTGLALVHKDEYIVPKFHAQSQTEPAKQSAGESKTYNYDYRTINIFDPNKMDLRREMRELGRK